MPARLHASVVSDVLGRELVQCTPKLDWGVTRGGWLYYGTWSHLRGRPVGARSVSQLGWLVGCLCRSVGGNVGWDVDGGRCITVQGRAKWSANVDIICTHWPVITCTVAACAQGNCTNEKYVVRCTFVCFSVHFDCVACTCDQTKIYTITCTVNPWKQRDSLVPHWPPRVNWLDGWRKQLSKFERNSFFSYSWIYFL